MTTHILLLLLAFCLMAKADVRLIQTECHSANAPKPCIQCLISNSRSLNADKFGIATLVIDCLEKQAGNLAGKFSALVKKNDSKKAYECVKVFSLAKEKLRSAAKEIKKADYDSADKLVFYARLCNSKCYAIGKGMSNSKAEGRLDSEMKKFDELSEAAMRIIERF